MRKISAFFRSKEAIPADGTGCRSALYGISYAAVWRRPLAAALDAVILWPAFVVIRHFADYCDYLWIVSSPQPYRQLEYPEVPDDLGLGFLAARLAAFAVIAWLYFALFESGERQATPGKRLLHITVADTSGDRIGFARASVRWLITLLASLLPVTLMLAFFTPRRQGLHDTVTGTIVTAD